MYFLLEMCLIGKGLKDYPENVIPYRGGGSDRISGVGFAGNSFDVEKIIEDNPCYGTLLLMKLVL